jgi:hypothetical protein
MAAGSAQGVNRRRGLLAMQLDEDKPQAEATRAGTGRLPPQISRLILLTVAIVASYFAARHFLVPVSFGQYGWYRGNALKEIAALPIAFAGRAACAECHTETAEQLAKSSHRTVACESCHDANAVHAEDPTVTPPPIKDVRFCLRCHAANPSRPAKFPQVEAADHYPDQGCLDCHRPHAPTEAPSK